MPSPRAAVVLAILGALCAIMSSNAFVVKPHLVNSARAGATQINLGNFGGGKKKEKPAEDLSFIESRDLTREEMLEINKKNEEIMNMELSAMTGFSLVLSLPILYLCWVAFFSD
eukprot:CAMPEP_0197452318 /NCGR_PEP_ID=MMETSP1175-20131217/31777_1 /TAXON_ID=1003142 /ORGANISM="Triceratium dubium, Strain CCMP147" /LENGTH=113 /DNA_ID=CAMNT_0042985299 /DNA_START=163 /DNA_END=504 /DNA_ORIENTATION=+